MAAAEEEEGESPTAAALSALSTRRADVEHQLEQLHTLTDLSATNGAHVEQGH